jgi:hypothetical protein
LALVFSMPHFAAVVAVPHIVFVEDVAEAVPLRAALQRHHHHVVGGTDAALVEHAGIGVGAGAQHGVQRIDAAEHGIIGLAALRAVVVEVERQRDHLALFDKPRRGDDVFSRRVIERADLVVGAPFAPVLVLLRRRAEIVSRHFAPCHWFRSCPAIDCNRTMIASPKRLGRALCLQWVSRRVCWRYA